MATQMVDFEGEDGVVVERTEGGEKDAAAQVGHGVAPGVSAAIRGEFGLGFNARRGVGGVPSRKGPCLFILS
jgi:hypothetical protein